MGRGGFVPGQGPIIQLTPDVILSCLLGKIDSSVIKKMTDVHPVVINDAILVAALLSVSDEDDLNAGNLAAVLGVTSMKFVDPIGHDRTAWPEDFSAEAIARVREKAQVRA